MSEEVFLFLSIFGEVVSCKKDKLTTRLSFTTFFKENVHATLLKIFEVQDRYADLNTIISDFKNH